MTYPRHINVLIFDNVNIMDIAGPVQAFNSAYKNGKSAYKHQFLSLDNKNIKTSCGLEIATQGTILKSSPKADLLIPGGCGIDALLNNKKLIEIIREQSRKQKNTRLISICSGALLLAAAGLLDGMQATTHWSRAEMVRSLFPNVKWTLNTLFTQSDNIYTSAGVSTGIDLALSIIQQDLGPQASLKVAQELVVYLRRTGGQSQFSQLLQAQFSLADPLSNLAEKIMSNPTKDWRLNDLADEVNMSSRTLSRRFKEALNIAPMQFVELTRLDYARTLLNNGVPIKQVAAKSGFGDLQRMRRSFKRHLSLSVSEYIQHFGPVEK